MKKSIVWLIWCAVLLLPALAWAQAGDPDPGLLWPTRTVGRCETLKPGPDGKPEVLDVPAAKMVHPTRMQALVLAAGTDLPACQANLAACRATPAPAVVQVVGDPWQVRLGLIGGGACLGLLLYGLLAVATSAGGG